MNDWAAVKPHMANALSDSRLQLHHAAQFATALGISFLPHAADDSHTNLEWLRSEGALASNVVATNKGALRIALRLHDLTLLAIADGAVTSTYPLDRCTIAQAATWIRAELAAHGLASERYTLARHYEIPPHAVDGGAPFRVDVETLDQLARWYSNASAMLEHVRQLNNGSTVRCWPHHFDIATLINLRDGASIGVGLEPGDAYYNEPYFYVNEHPQPAESALADSLAGGGFWHTHEWIGAVLPASRIRADAALQEPQARAFLESAIATLRKIFSLS